MSELGNGKVTLAAQPPEVGEPAIGPVIDAVRHAALDLLASLPERPERLRVQAAEVSIDLDWRVAVASPSSVHHGQAGSAPGKAERREPVAADDDSLVHYVCAPTVGTFYRAPEPGAAPFVASGTTVNPGQQVGIVEAMKLMLPVEADRAGRVIEVLVADGQSVEYGERLVALDQVDGS